MASARKLTQEEIFTARKIFGDRINYEQVNIIHGKYFFLQRKGTIMAPNGNIYWPGAPSNLVIHEGLAVAATFIHEMTHIMQYQRGVNVRFKGFILQAARFLSFGLYNPYKFVYDPKRSFSSYNIEQQGIYAIEIFLNRLPNVID